MYDINGTTTTMHLEGHRITTQLLPNGSGVCVVFDAKDEQTQVVTFGKVYVIDKML